MYSNSFTTSFGFGVVYATGQGIVKVEIPDVCRQQQLLHENIPECSPSGLTIQAADLLQRYFQGEHVDFGEIPVMLDDRSAFQQKVLRQLRKLGYGEISTYRRIAELCGSPLAARAVGGAVASNPIPVIIPCHRVVSSDGHLTGFSAPGGKGAKMLLLKMEGVVFNEETVVINQQVMHSIQNR